MTSLKSPNLNNNVHKASPYNCRVGITFVSDLCLINMFVLTKFRLDIGGEKKKHVRVVKLEVTVAI